VCIKIKQPCWKTSKYKIYRKNIYKIYRKGTGNQGEHAFKDKPYMQGLTTREGKRLREKPNKSAGLKGNRLASQDIRRGRKHGSILHGGPETNKNQDRTIQNQNRTTTWTNKIKDRS
jgi:hypothetical protein